MILFVFSVRFIPTFLFYSSTFILVRCATEDHGLQMNLTQVLSPEATETTIFSFAPSLGPTPRVNLAFETSVAENILDSLGVQGQGRYRVNPNSNPYSQDKLSL